MVTSLYNKTDWYQYEAKQMSTKGQQTRERIVEASAALFNVRGYTGTAMSDIIESVGIQKGGIYRHFESKESIMLAAFEYAMQRRIEAIQMMLVPTASAIDQLQAVCASFIALLEPPSLPGGCPILNAAVEADDLYPPLREKVQQGLNTLRMLISQVVADGKARGELQPYVNGDVVATLLISACEGALMMTKLYGDCVHLHRAVDHLHAYFETLRA
jgi:AcrR family transcriptional regulator